MTTAACGFGISVNFNAVLRFFIIFCAVLRFSDLPYDPLFICRKVGPARRATLPSQKGDPARRVTLLAEPTFCFSCKWFAKFCKELYEKLARPG